MIHSESNGVFFIKINIYFKILKIKICLLDFFKSITNNLYIALWQNLFVIKISSFPYIFWKSYMFWKSKSGIDSILPSYYVSQYLGLKCLRVFIYSVVNINSVISIFFLYFLEFTLIFLDLFILLFCLFWFFYIFIFFQFTIICAIKFCSVFWAFYCCYYFPFSYIYMLRQKL